MSTAVSEVLVIVVVLWLCCMWCNNPYLAYTSNGIWKGLVCLHFIDVILYIVQKLGIQAGE